MNELNEKFGMMLSEIFTTYSETNGVLQPIYTSDTVTAGKLIDIERAACAIGKTNGALFSIKQDSLKRKYIHTSKHGYMVFSGLLAYDFYIDQQRPAQKLSPKIEVFIECMKDRCLDGASFLCSRSMFLSSIEYVDLLNSFVEQVRHLLKSKNVVNNIKSRRRSMIKNHRQLVSYFSSHLNAHSKLFVIRIDFGYIKEANFVKNGAKLISYEDVRRHREMFIEKFKKNKIFEHMSGYAWKIEYGLNNGFNVHVVFLFDGANIQKDVTNTKAIGELWINEATKGLGLYRDCDTYKTYHKSSGIGMISKDDKVGVEGLKRAAEYMTKTDFLIKFAAPNKGRTFGKGAAPKKKK